MTSVARMNATERMNATATGDQVKQQDHQPSRGELDEAALARIRAVVARIFYRRSGLGRFVESEDVVQEVALRLLRRAAESPTQPGTEVPLALEVRRAVCDLYRHYCGRGSDRPRPESMSLELQIEEHGEPEWIGTEPAAAELLECADGWTQFFDRARSLSKVDRLVFDLLWFERRSQKEIAELIGVTPRTVRSRWARIRRTLGPLMEEVLAASS